MRYFYSSYLTYSGSCAVDTPHISSLIINITIGEKIQSIENEEFWTEDVWFLINMINLFDLSY